MSVNRVIGGVAPQVDGTLGVLPYRTDPYGAAQVYGAAGDLGAFADEGTMYIIQTTTPGTGIAGHAAPVQADVSTKPVFHLFNGSSTKTIIPKWIKIRITTAGAGGTDTNLENWLDSGGGVTTRSGAGTLVSPAICTLGGASVPSSAATAFIGAVTAVAVNAKRVGHFKVRSTIEIVEDVYLIVFGAAAQSVFGPVVATLNNYCVPMAGCAVPPLTNWQVHHWGASHSGASSYDIQACYVER